MVVGTAEAKPPILVIDDEIGPRESLRILLKNNYEVICAESVDKGIEFLKTHTPELVIIDIKMPGKDGIVGLREIRAIDPIVVVIMLTGYGTLQTAQESIRLGANDYVNKPFDINEMQELVRKNVHETQLHRRRASAENELTELNQRLTKELSQKEHLAELGQVSAEFAHDLRNPLTIVLGYVHILATKLETPEELAASREQFTGKYLSVIEKNITRCHELVDMWQSLSNKKQPRQECLDLSVILNDIVLSMTADDYDARIEFVMNVDACRLIGDNTQIYRALNNVITNAVQSLQDRGGRISITCKRINDEIEIVIDDTGCGMDAELIAHIFDPYYTTKAVKGTGLGLFITRKVIEQHRGTITVASEPDAGSTLTIRLPTANAVDIRPKNDDADSDAPEDG